MARMSKRKRVELERERVRQSRTQPPPPRPSRKLSKSDVIRAVQQKARETEGYYKLLDELGEGAVKEKVRKVPI